jgi:hypothetical protein
MDTIKLVIDNQGQLESILTDGETNIQVLKRGRDDNAIDEFEAILDIVDFE